MQAELFLAVETAEAGGGLVVEQRVVATSLPLFRSRTPMWRQCGS